IRRRRTLRTRAGPGRDIRTSGVRQKRDWQRRRVGNEMRREKKESLARREGRLWFGIHLRLRWEDVGGARGKCLAALTRLARMDGCGFARKSWAERVWVVTGGSLGGA